MNTDVEGDGNFASEFSGSVDVSLVKREILTDEECEDEFNNTQNFEIQNCLNSDVTVKHEEEKPRVYSCKKCGAEFNKSTLLYDHMKVHSRIKAALSRRKYKKNIDRSNFHHECKTCGKAFEKPSQLERHVRTHTGERPYQCDHCDKAFNQKGALQIHMTQHTGIRPHRCQFCFAAFSQKGNLRAHIQRVHMTSKIDEDQPVYQCEECGCAFHKLSSLNGHMTRAHPKYLQSEENKLELEHFYETTESSDVEGQTFTSDSNHHVTSGTTETRTTSNVIMGSFRKHVVRKIDGISWHICMYCNREFRKTSDLTRHIRIHTQEKPFKCGQCFRAFSKKGTLTVHARTHFGLKPYSCSTCGKLFSTQGSLDVHARLHTGSKPYECPHCNKWFRTSGHRSSHILSHFHHLKPKRPSADAGPNEVSIPGIDFQTPLIITDSGLTQQRTKKSMPSNTANTSERLERPHQCSICPGAFKKSSHLKQHMRSHTGEKPFQCQQCGSSFSSGGVLKAHLRTHTGIKDFTCTLCDASFTTKGSLTRHESVHRENRPFMCPRCQKTFKTTGSCRHHMKTHRLELAMHADAARIMVGDIDDEATAPLNSSLDIPAEKTATPISDSQDVAEHPYSLVAVKEFELKHEVSEEKPVDIQYSFTENMELLIKTETSPEEVLGC